MGIGFELVLSVLLAAQALGIVTMWLASRRRRTNRPGRSPQPAPARRLARAPAEQRFFPVGTTPQDGHSLERTARHVPLPIRRTGERGRWPRHSQEPPRPVLRPAWERPATWSELVDEEDAVTPVRLPGMSEAAESAEPTRPRAKVPVYSLDEAKYLLARHRRGKPLAN